MKKLSILLFSTLLLILAGPTLADKPNAKQIRHCGCVYDSLEGVSMIFHDLFVPGNNQGHRNHLATTEDYELCFAGLDVNEEPTYEMWVRDATDCMKSGINANLINCVDEVELDPCGSEYVPQPE